MGLFDTIREKVFGKLEDQSARDAGSSTAADPTTASMPVTPNIESEVAATLGGANAEPARVGPNGPIDVVGILDDAADKNSGGLEWRDSIVDLLKILGLDASLDERKQLAGELGYAGDEQDQATLDAWLHKALIQALAENDGNVPSRLKD